MSKKVTLPSGAELEVHVAPFLVAKSLYQAVLDESKGLKLDASAEIDVNLWKDLFCTMLSSKKVEACLYECMKRSLYNGAKISPEDTFESVDARGDYLDVCFEVAKENILPFTKSLFAKYKDVLAQFSAAKQSQA